MVDPAVRPARPADSSSLERLGRQARTALAGQRGGPRWLATHPALAWEELIAAGRVELAHIGEVVVGYVVVTIEPPVARVDAVYVEPEARELGFGDELLAATIARARAAGCAVLEAEALPGDRETKNLYERAGVKARLIIVSLDLTSGP